MKQLYSRDLRPGDILLKANYGSVVNRIINFGQRMVGMKNAEIVHAGIMIDNRFIAEAQHGGINVNDLFMRDKNFGYLAFRPTNPNLANGASTCAKMMFDIHKRTGGMNYSIPGAVKSLFGSGKPMTAGGFDELLERVLKGGKEGFFCSRFVVFVYQFVAEQNRIPGACVFPMGDAVCPAVLATNLADNRLFQEIGFLAPGERN